MWAEAQINRLTKPIINHYATGQTFKTIQDGRGVMYFAHPSGVIIFDGINWKTVKTAAAVSSFAIDTTDNTIYVGAKGDIGKLVSNEASEYEFMSLFDQIPEDQNNFSEIYKIMIDPKEGVVFASQSTIFILQNDRIKAIPTDSKHSFDGIFNVDGHLYIIQKQIGIKELKNGELHDIKQFDEIAKEGTIRLIDKSQGRLTIVNRTKGLYFYEGDSIRHIDPFPLGKNVLDDISCISKTHDGHYLLGTQWNGLFITDRDFNLINKVEIDARISSIYEDTNHLLWVTTYKGVFLLNIYSAFSWFSNSETGIEGSIRSILQVKDNLYIGADAVYHLKIDSLSNPRFKKIANKKGDGSIWKLDTIQGLTIGCYENGLFSIDTNNLIHNSEEEERNIRNFLIPRENPNILIGSALRGFSIYEKENGQWKYKRGVSDLYARHIFQDTDGSIVFSDKSKGVFRLKFNETFDSVLSVKKYNAEKGGLPFDTDNYLFDTGNGLVIGSRDGFYKYNGDSDMYEEDTKLNTAFGGKKTFVMMYNDGIGNLWMKHEVFDKREQKTDWFLESYTMLGDTSAKIADDIFRPFKSRIYSFGYIGNGCYIIGDKDGFIHYNSKVETNVNIPYHALISKISNIYSDSLIYGGNEDEKKIVLPYSQRSLRVEFGATFYENPDIKFKSYLENNDDEWSDFRSDTYKEYPNLSPGKYILHVKAVNYYNIESQEATITISILPPWYLTIGAKMFYALLFALAIWLFVKAYTKKLIRDKEKLEKIVEERTAEIRKQSQLILEKNEEITAKNKEITDSIRYAQRIQTAMLPMEEKIQAALPEHFILFRPKDIVSGDYYWFAETENSVVITAADCTGHGVPGAFMSMIGSQILTEIVVEGITSPEQILTNQNRRIRKALKQDTTANQDGMDMALCTIDKKTHLVEYSGAKNQLVVIQNNELTEYKADKQSIGGQQLYGDDFQYKKVAIQPDGNTWFYMFSDGYKDQFGGENNTKFLIKNLRALFMQIHNEPPAKQREILNDTIEKWIKDGNTEQTDDIIIIGFKL